MLTKIQKYLLLNYPLLWNTKLVPISLVTICLNVLFFFIGYISTELDINNFDYPYYSEDKEYVFKSIAVFTSILVIIIWLIFYLKNNAFKSFYPKTSKSLYLEWLLVFFILLGSTFFTNSYILGSYYKQRSYCSLDEIKKNINLLDRIQVFTPNDAYNYSSTLPETNSLLNIGTKYSYETEKNWLKEGNTDSIKSLMNQYLQLQRKHNLQTNLTLDSWFNLIYQPPYFPKTKDNHIYLRKTINDSYNPYYIEYHKLSNYYNKIYDSYFIHISKHLLPPIYIALFLSIALFSFRVTSGKSWLISLVIVGLLYFILGLIYIIYESAFNHSSKYFTTIFNGYWTLIFLTLLAFIGYKLLSKSSKGKSAIQINICLWILPFLLLIQYMNYMEKDNYSKKTSSSIYNFFYENSHVFPWINLIFVIAILPFVMNLIKKWRALPEE